MSEVKGRPMSEAPKDRPILAYCEGDCKDPECRFFTGKGASLCIYHGHGEGLSYTAEGFAVIEWGGGYSESDDMGCHLYTIPDWWFRVGSEFEEVANPVEWWELPARGHP